MGSFNDNVKKKYDSTYFAMNTNIHRPHENNLLLPLNLGNDAVNV